MEKTVPSKQRCHIPLASFRNQLIFTLGLTEKTYFQNEKRLLSQNINISNVLIQFRSRKHF